MDKNQIKAELANIQNELRMSIENLNTAATKFTLVLDRYGMAQLGGGRLRTPPPRGIVGAQQPTAVRPITAPPAVGGYRASARANLNDSSFEVIGDDDVFEPGLEEALVCDTQGCRRYNSPAGRRC